MSRPVATPLDTDYLLTIEQVADRYAKAGHPRTIRSLQRYCAKGHLDSQKKETALGGEIYLVTPQSVARHIAQIEELMAGDTVAIGHDASRPVATPVVAQPSLGQHELLPATTDDMSRFVARLEIELEQAKDERDFLKEQIDRKDRTIDALIERDRETNFLVRGLQEMLTPLLGGSRRDMSHGLPSSSGRHHFRLLTSFRIALSSIASARSFFSLPFSSSSRRPKAGQQTAFDEQPGRDRTAVSGRRQSGTPGWPSEILADCLPGPMLSARLGWRLRRTSMKITRITDLHADAGWRVFSFLRVETDAGIIGWSEYNEKYGSKGLTAVILNLAETLIGQDPRPVERIIAHLHGLTRQAPGGLIQQAIAAIENALVDVKAKALGVPVSEMLGGPVHDRLRLYWSHCGTYLLHHADKMGLPPIRNLDDVRKLGERVRGRGFSALKTNIFLFEGAAPELYMPGFARSPGGPELNPSLRVEEALDKQLAALRDGTGNGVEFLLDLNFNFKTEGYIRLVRELEKRHRLLWVEIDSFDPRALALIRRSISTPLASCESLFGRRQFKDYFENYAMDVGIIDVPWNGILESVKIAHMADPYEVNCAPHNFYGHLSTLMSAHLCASIPNFRIMEIEVDDVPWKDELVTEPPRIENGHLIMPKTPGWGADVNEAGVRRHPPK